MKHSKYSIFLFAFMLFGCGDPPNDGGSKITITNAMSSKARGIAHLGADSLRFKVYSKYGGTLSETGKDSVTLYPEDGDGIIIFQVDNQAGYEEATKVKEGDMVTISVDSSRCPYSPFSNNSSCYKVTINN